MEEYSSISDVTFDEHIQITQKPLSASDKRKIRQQIIFTSVISLVAIGIFSTIFYFISSGFGNDTGFHMIPMIMFGLIGCFFIFVISLLFTKSIKDLRGGVKNVIEGIVDDKRLDVQTTTSTSHGTGHRGGSRTRSSTKRYYYITIGGKEYKVTPKMLNDVSVGDKITLEMSPHSEVVLHYDILHNTEKVVDRTAFRQHSKNYPNSKIKEAPLQRKEKDNVVAFYTQKRNRRLKIIGFVCLPIAFLLVSKLGWLLVLFFPLPIILCYQLYKFIKLYLNYKADMDAGRKKVITTHIIDKTYTTIKKNGVSTVKYLLKTTYKNVYVNHDIYNRMHTGDEVTLHETLHLKNIIGVISDEQYYHNS